MSGTGWARSAMARISIAIGLCLAAACGTTVPGGGVSGPGALDGGDSNLRAPAVTTGQPGLDAGVGSVTAGGAVPAPGGSVGGPGATGAVLGTAGAATPQPGTSGRGFTKDKIYLGLNSWQDVGQVSTLLGGAALDTGDQQAHARAVIAVINKNGGLAGRQIEPVFYDFKTNRLAGDVAIVTQEACSLWTEDRPVFAVVYGGAMGLLDDGVAACLSRVGVPMVLMNYMGMSSWFTKYPLVWAPMSPLTARYLPAVIQRAKVKGYFGGWDTLFGQAGTAPVKVGIQTGTGKYAPETVKVLTAAVKAAGYQVVATAQVDGAGDGPGASAAVLSFRDKGVTHVMQDSQCVGGTVAFMSTADSQGYHPRYLMHTGNCPRLLMGFTPANQWRGALGAGNQSAMDVAWAQDPGDPSPARARCQKTMRDAGREPKRSRDEFAFMVWYCDGFDFLVSAMRAGGNLPSTQAFLRGAQSIRTQPPSAAFAISLLNRRDGAAALRDLAYDESCQCAVYVGGNHTF